MSEQNPQFDLPFFLNKGYMLFPPPSEQLVRSLKQQADIIANYFGVGAPATPAPTAESTAQPDGPIKPGIFRWKGKEAKCYRKPWLILAFMWDRQEASTKELKQKVWTDHRLASADAFKSALRRANLCLTNAGVPWTLHQDRDGYIRKY